MTTLAASPTDQIREACARHFGFEELKPGQMEVMEHLLEGRSAAAVYPTGGGKSLCYQLPALLLPGLTLVVSPLIALMKDQIDALARRGIAAARLDSTLSFDEYVAVMDEVRSGQLKLLYVAPERFNNERFREAILQTQVSLFAVDEAHCISEWGHNFRPDYLKLAEFARTAEAERLLALTATATDAVLSDICENFQIEPRAAVRTGFYRPNLTLLTTPVDARQRDSMLLDRLRQRPVGPTIVYVTLQKTAEHVADRLAAAGLPAKAYHAGMKDDQRAETQDWFMQSDRAIVVATIAFGMGIDKTDIRYVYHYNLPKSLENYSQEIGRAGRDGEPSICEMLAAVDDLNTLENFVYGDTPSRAAVKSLVDDLFSLGEEFDVSIYDLARQHDIRDLVVRTLLTYLELDGYLEGGTPFYSQYQFKPLMSSAEILGKFEGDRRAFLADLFRQAHKAKVWLTLDVDRAAATLKTPRERIVRALDYLGEQQMLEVKAAGVRNRYRRLKQPPSQAGLAEELHDRTLDRETREIGRLGEVLELIAEDGCQVSALGAHFAESLDSKCGHCSWCDHGRANFDWHNRPRASIDEDVWRQALQLRGQHSEAIGDSRCFARFLVGVSSPALSRAKLTRELLCGALAGVPFGEVLARAESG